MLDYNQKFITVDCESRHLNLHIHDGNVENCNYPWEVAWIESCGKFTNKEVQHFVDVPNLNLSDLVKKLTNFNEQDYNKKKRPPEECWTDLKKVLYNKENMIVGQNILGFDIFLFGILAKMCGEKINWSFLDRVIDTRALGMAYKNKIEPPRNGSLINWQFKILNDRSLKGRVSQTALLKEFGLESFDEGKRHSGLVDVKDTYNIFQKLRFALKL